MSAIDTLPDSLIRAHRELEEQAIADFFGGSMERAEKMLRLFPGRYTVDLQRKSSDSFAFAVPDTRMVIRDLWTKRTERHILRVNLVLEP